MKIKSDEIRSKTDLDRALIKIMIIVFKSKQLTEIQMLLYLFLH